MCQTLRILIQKASYQYMNTKSLLNNLLSEINSINQMDLFLKALFTNKELKELENRIKIFQLLLQGKKQREISKMLNVGIATVTRGANAFENEKIFEVKIPILETLRLYKNKKNE